MRAIFRFFRAFWYSWTGDFSKWAEVWESKPAFVRAQYDDIEREQKNSINDVTDAVSELMALKKEQEHRHDQLLNDPKDSIDRCRRLMKGAESKAAKIAQKLKAEGKTKEEIKGNLDYVKCSTAYKDFKSTLKAKEEEAIRIEREIESYDKQLKGHQLHLQRMLRELEGIRREKNETIVDMEIAKQRDKANRAVAKISDSATGEARERMQKLRRKIVSQAEITGELAGTNVQNEEDEFLQYAMETEASDEFDALVGLEESPAENVESEVDSEKTQLPK